MGRLWVFAILFAVTTGVERGAAQVVIGPPLDDGPGIDGCAADGPDCPQFVPDLTPVPLPPAGLALLGGVALLYGMRRLRGPR